MTLPKPTWGKNRHSEKGFDSGEYYAELAQRVETRVAVDVSKIQSKRTALSIAKHAARIELKQIFDKEVKERALARQLAS